MAKVPEVLLVDQDPQARYELKQLVIQSQLGVVGESSFGTEAVSLATDARPDVIVCGMSDPPERALRTIEALLDVLPETPIVSYGWQDEVAIVRRAMQAGARDYFVMPIDSARLLDSITLVLEAEERKRLRMSGQTKSLGPRGLTLAVFGAKGGVGKSTIASNLGVALAGDLGQSVVLVDGDNSFGDVAAMLETHVERTVLDLVRDVDTVDRAELTEYLTRHDDSGLWLLPAPTEPLRWRSVTPDAIRKVITVLTRRFDVVLVDTAGVLNDFSLAILEESNMVLWVTSSDFSSINNTLLGLKALEELSYPESRIKLMLNVVSADDGVRPVKIEEVLGRKFFWSLPYDREVRMGGQIGRPVVAANPNSDGARSLIDLARSLTGAAPARAVKKSTPVRRLLNRFTRGGTAAAPVEGRL
ncbi:MAG: AAA family ATPase [Chloroflexi bacterium]|nr:AAA family ATPase [Chloroflexota bacterium]